MSWTFGDFIIEEMALEHFLKDSTAAGKVYFVKEDPFKGEPILQVHVFPDVYTLFWPSIPENPPITSLIRHAFQDVVQRRNSYGAPEQPQISSPNSWVSLSILEPANHELVETRESFSPYNSNMEEFLSSTWNNTVSVYATLPPLPEGSALSTFSLWTDTTMTPLQAKETGITASRGSVPPPKVIELLTGTSVFFSKTGPATIPTVREMLAFLGR